MRDLHSFSRSTTDSYQLMPESISDIQLEDPGTLTATASFLYLPVPPLIISNSTLEQSLSGTVCLSLSLRTLNLNSPFPHSTTTFPHPINLRLRRVGLTGK